MWSLCWFRWGVWTERYMGQSEDSTCLHQKGENITCEKLCHELLDLCYFNRNLQLNCLNRKVLFFSLGLFDFGITASCHYRHRCRVHVCVSIHNNNAAFGIIYFAVVSAGVCRICICVTGRFFFLLSQWTRQILCSEEPGCLLGFLVSLCPHSLHIASSYWKLGENNVALSSGVYFIVHMVLVCCKGPRWV